MNNVNNNIFELVKALEQQIEELKNNCNKLEKQNTFWQDLLLIQTEKIFQEEKNRDFKDFATDHISNLVLQQNKINHIEIPINLETENQTQIVINVSDKKEENLSELIVEEEEEEEEVDINVQSPVVLKFEEHAQTLAEIKISEEIEELELEGSKGGKWEGNNQNCLKRIWKKYYKSTNSENLKEHKYPLFNCISSGKDPYCTNISLIKILAPEIRLQYLLTQRNPQEELIFVIMNQRSSFFLEIVDWLSKKMSFGLLDISNMPLIPVEENCISKKKYKQVQRIRNKYKVCKLLIVTWMATDKWKQEIINGVEYENLQKIYSVFHILLCPANFNSPIPDYIKQNCFQFFVDPVKKKKSHLKSELYRQHKLGEQFFTDANINSGSCCIL